MLEQHIIPSVLCLALVAVGCGDDDNPVDAHHGEEHAEAIGLIIRDGGSGGAEIVRNESGKVSGEIEVGHGKETALLSVRFIAEDGDLFSPHTEDGFSLAGKSPMKASLRSISMLKTALGTSTSSASKTARPPYA